MVDKETGTVGQRKTEKERERRKDRKDTHTELKKLE